MRKLRGPDHFRRKYLTFEQEQEKAEKDRLKQNEYRKNNYRKKAELAKASKEATENS